MLRLSLVTNRLRRGFSATQIIVIGFLFLILAGALLLHLPIATSSGESAPFLTCLFTAVSATCVTGLVVVDTATFWSLFGHIVILVMIQIGGLGFMTMAVLLSMMIRRRISPRERLVLANSYNLTSFDGVLPLVGRIVRGTLLVELFGALLLSIRFIPLFGAGSGIWRSVFHAVSAFCNAGFDLMGSFTGPFSSMTYFVDDPLVSLTLVLLIAIGGIGFVVWEDLLCFIKKRRRVSSYTTLVLTVSAFLWLLGALVVAVAEWNNPETLGKLSVGDKCLAALFQSVTMRTAGFNTINLAAAGGVPKILFLLLMFVGGASGSTAGGVKVATFGVFIAAVWQFAIGKKRVSLFRRTVSSADITRVFALTAVQFGITVFAATFLVGQGVDMTSALFETFSASGTVGLSLSLTPALGAMARVVIMLLMFFGRVGILTVTAALHDRSRDEDNQMHYADAQFMIG